MTALLTAYRSSQLSLDELTATAARLLGALGLRQVDDGRVAPRPDVRAIRYYQTLGLIDKPIAYQGRRAVYGYRHLLQLLAIRRLQKEGYSLSVIQARLSATSTSALERALVAATDALRRGPTLAPAPPPSTARTVITGEIAPGITLTVDPGRVPDAERVFREAATRIALITGEVDASRDH